MSSLQERQRNLELLRERRRREEAEAEERRQRRIKTEVKAEVKDQEVPHRPSPPAKLSNAERDRRRAQLLRAPRPEVRTTTATSVKTAPWTERQTLSTTSRTPQRPASTSSPSPTRGQTEVKLTKAASSRPLPKTVSSSSNRLEKPEPDHDYRTEIWKLFGKDRAKYQADVISDDEADDLEDVGFSDVEREERRSVALAKREDAEEEARLVAAARAKAKRAKLKQGGHWS